MKILVAHNRYQSLGGEDLAAGVEMELVEKHGHIIERFEVDNVRIEGFREKTKAALGSVYSTSSKMRLTQRIRCFKPDIVHVHNFFPLLSPSIHYACQRTGTPIVQSVHNYRMICPNGLLLRDGRPCEDCVGKAIPWPGVWHACYRNSRVGSTVVAAMLATHHFLGTWQKTVEAYIARTNFSRKKLIEGGFPAEKISVIPSFAPDPGGAMESTGRFALFVGRLAPEKGIETLLAAWSELSGCLPLKVVGDGPLRGQVLQQAEAGRVDYVGSLPRDRVQALMHDAAFLIFPSDCYENFPLVIAEAFAAGVPVIASDRGAMAEIVDHGRTGLLFRPGGVADLAAKIDWALGHPDEMARMRREARAEYVARYTPEQNYRMLIELYQRTIYNGRASVSN